jgi:hypothetical protein
MYKFHFSSNVLLILYFREKGPLLGEGGKMVEWGWGTMEAKERLSPFSSYILVFKKGPVYEGNLCNIVCS